MEIKMNSVWEWKLARICYHKMWSFRCLKFFLENLDDKPKYTNDIHILSLIGI